MPRRAHRRAASRRAARAALQAAAAGPSEAVLPPATQPRCCRPQGWCHCEPRCERALTHLWVPRDERCEACVRMGPVQHAHGADHRRLRAHGGLGVGPAAAARQARRLGEHERCGAVLGGVDVLGRAVHGLRGATQKGQGGRGCESRVGVCAAAVAGLRGA